MPSYIESNSLNIYGREIMDKYHSGLKVLSVRFILREKAQHTRDKIVPAKTYRCSDRDKNCHGHDFIIEVAKDVWDAADERFRTAIVDHQLASIGVYYDEEGEPMRLPNERIKTFVRPPDIQEYHEVMERHGAYHVDLRKFLSVLEEKEKKPATTTTQDDDIPDGTVEAEFDTEEAGQTEPETEEVHNEEPELTLEDLDMDDFLLEDTTPGGEDGPEKDLPVLEFE